MEKPLYPSPYMRITQGYNVGTHLDSYAIDEAGSDSGIDFILAPFTGVIKKIYPNDANEVWLESLEQVEYPDGTIDYMTMMFAHDNDVSNLKVGQVIQKGTRFYKREQKETPLVIMFIWNVEKVSLQVVAGIKIVLDIGRLIIQRNQRNVYG